jgi:transposase
MDDSSIAKLIVQGASLRAIGRRIGLSATTVYRRIVADGDTLPRRRRRPLRSADRRRILEIARDGETSIRRIAATVNRSWHTVRRIVATEDLPRITAAHRCPRCGHYIVLTPCVICRARAS